MNLRILCGKSYKIVIKNGRLIAIKAKELQNDKRE